MQCVAACTVHSSHIATTSSEPESYSIMTLVDSVMKR